jgi:hypothetical protein
MRSTALILLLAATACTPAPMPPPAAGHASPQDAMAPDDVAARDAANAAPAAAPAPAALPPPGLGDPEPVANDLGTPVADGWVGSWRGPEGTSLLIEKQEVGYRLVITNLDGPREFHGVAAADVIEFERDGATLALHAGNGEATGMKWLAGKQDCLVVARGEGYCRD